MLEEVPFRERYACLRERRPRRLARSSAHPVVQRNVCHFHTSGSSAHGTHPPLARATGTSTESLLLALYLLITGFSAHFRSFTSGSALLIARPNRSIPLITAHYEA